MSLTWETLGNVKVFTATFVDDDDEPVEPDGDVTWAVQATGDYEATETVQAGDTAVSTGVYERAIVFDDPAVRGYTVKASAVVGGLAQATSQAFTAVLP